MLKNPNSDDSLSRYILRAMKRSPKGKGASLNDLNKFGAIKNIDNGHWNMFGFDFKNKIIVCGESSGTVDKSYVDEVIVLLQRILNLMNIQFDIQAWNIQRWESEQQQNGFDCGCYGLLNLIKFLFGIEYTKSNIVSWMKDFRKKLLSSVMCEEIYFSDRYSSILETAKVDNFKYIAENLIQDIKVLENIGKVNTDEETVDKSLSYSYNNFIELLGSKALLQSDVSLLCIDKLVELFVCDYIENNGVKLSYESDNNNGLNAVSNLVNKRVLEFLVMFDKKVKAFSEDEAMVQDNFTGQFLNIVNLADKIIEDCAEINSNIHTGFSFYNVIKSLGGNIEKVIGQMGDGFQFKYMAAQYLSTYSDKPLAKALMGNLDEMFQLLKYFDSQVSVIKYNNILEEYILLSGKPDNSSYSIYKTEHTLNEILNNSKYVIIVITGNFYLFSTDYTKEKIRILPLEMSKFIEPLVRLENYIETMKADNFDQETFDKVLPQFEMLNKSIHNDECCHQLKLFIRAKVSAKFISNREKSYDDVNPNVVQSMFTSLVDGEAKAK